MRRNLLIIVTIVLVCSAVGIGVTKLILNSQRPNPPPIGEIVSANFLVRTSSTTFGEPLELDPEDRAPFLAAIQADLTSLDYWSSDAHVQWSDFMVCVTDGSNSRSFYVISDSHLHDLTWNVAWRADNSAVFLRKYRDRYRKASLRKMGYIVD